MSISDFTGHPYINAIIAKIKELVVAFNGMWDGNKLVFPNNTGKMWIS